MSDEAYGDAIAETAADVRKCLLRLQTNREHLEAMTQELEDALERLLKNGWLTGIILHRSILKAARRGRRVRGIRQQLRLKLGDLRESERDINRASEDLLRVMQTMLEQVPRMQAKQATDHLNSLYHRLLERITLYHQQSDAVAATIRAVGPIVFEDRTRDVARGYLPGLDATQPPKLADYVLDLLLPVKHRDSVPGCIHERFNELYAGRILPKYGRLWAQLWYWWQALGAIVDLTWPRIRKAAIGIALISGANSAKDKCGELLHIVAEFLKRISQQ